MHRGTYNFVKFAKLQFCKCLKMCYCYFLLQLKDCVKNEGGLLLAGGRAQEH